MTTIFQTLARAGCAAALAAAALAASPAGCDRTQTIDTRLATAPALPDAMQGTWRFDRERTLELWARILPEDLYQQEMHFVAAMDELDHPLHTDLRIQGAAIIGDIGDHGGGVEPQYDLTDWTQVEGGIVAQAWWHEDRHDPGDPKMQAMVLRLDQNLFWLGFGDGGPRTLWFIFRR